MKNVADWLFCIFLAVSAASIASLTVAAFVYGTESEQERELASDMVLKAFNAANQQNPDALYALFVLKKAVETAPYATSAELRTSFDYRLRIGEEKEAEFETPCG